MFSIYCNSRVTKRLINKYKQEGINAPSEKDDWKKFEKSNATIGLIVNP